MSPNVDIFSSGDYVSYSTVHPQGESITGARGLRLCTMLASLVLPCCRNCSPNHDPELDQRLLFHLQRLLSSTRSRFGELRLTRPNNPPASPLLNLGHSWLDSAAMEYGRRVAYRGWSHVIQPRTLETWGAPDANRCTYCTPLLHLYIRGSCYHKGFCSARKRQKCGGRTSPAPAITYNTTTCPHSPRCPTCSDHDLRKWKAEGRDLQDPEPSHRGLR